MAEHLQFASRVEFRNWLKENCTSSSGVWLVFGKLGGPSTVKATEALEEALCFGWIDGQMQRVDDTTYIKYFSARRKSSKWSDKNKAIVEKLEQQGIMTGYGRAKIEEAKSNGQWEAKKTEVVTEERIHYLSELLKTHEPAHTNFLAMSPSVKKTYTKAYFSAKTDSGRVSRLSWMVERLNQNLKPM